MFELCTACCSAALSSARDRTAKIGSVSTCASSLNDELGVQRAGPLDALKNCDDFARRRLHGAQRIDEILDGGALLQRHRLKAGLAHLDARLGYDGRANARAGTVIDAVRLRDEIVLR